MRADDDLSHAAGPEAHARKVIDAALAAAGWIVQSRADPNLHAGPGIAVRETPTRTGPADYILFLDGRACGVLEAKPEGTTLLGVVNQGAGYARAAPAGYRAWADPLPFVYVSSGAETLFQDARDHASSPGARPRRTADMEEFVTLAKLADRARRQETERFRRFAYADLAAREKRDLNLSWLREDGATDPASLPPPAEIAASIAEDLEAALARFRAVAARLG